MARKPMPTIYYNWREWIDFAEANIQPDEWMAIDLETTGLSPWNNSIAVVGLYHEATHTAGVLHFPLTTEERLDGERKRLPKELVEWLSRRHHKFVVFNGVGFDWYFLHEAGVNIFNPTWYDAMVAEGCAVKAARRDVKVSLEKAYIRRLKLDLKEKIDHRTWQLPTLSPEQLSYVAADIMYLPDLRRAQLEEIAGDTRMQANDLEQQLSLVIARMIINGLPIRMEDVTDENGEFWQSFPNYIADMENIRDLHAYRLFKLAGRPFMVTSPAQIKAVFLEHNRPIASTNEATMVRIRDGTEPSSWSHQMAVNILGYRTSSQRPKMYDDDFFKAHVHPKLNPARPDEVICQHVRARYWQVGTETGRFSSSDPNLQQVAGDCRTFFGEEPGQVCLSADYSQLEVRIAAWLARDDALLEAVDAEDVHSAVASQLFQIAVELVTPEQRKLSKAGTFTFLFGGGAELLYETARTDGADITLSQAKDFEHMFFARFRGLAQKRAWAYNICRTRQSYTTVMPHGLIRHLAGVDFRPTTLINTEVQGGAASGVKMAMVIMGKLGLDQYLRGTVHDEFIMIAAPELMGTDFNSDAYDTIASKTRFAMEEGMRITFPGEIDGKPFPVKVEGYIGPRWKGMKPLTMDSIETRSHGKKAVNRSLSVRPDVIDASGEPASTKDRQVIELLAAIEEGRLIRAGKDIRAVTAQQDEAVLELIDGFTVTPVNDRRREALARDMEAEAKRPTYLALRDENE